MKKNWSSFFHLHHRLAQEAWRLLCFSSFCCGALLHKKTSLIIIGGPPLSSRGGTLEPVVYATDYIKDWCVAVKVGQDVCLVWGKTINSSSYWGNFWERNNFGRPWTRWEDNIKLSTEMRLKFP
jgi:hypothetical protein